MVRTTAAQARAEIVAAARALFAEHGYEATSLQDIATRLGGSKAGVLYHFGSKAQILRELVEPSAAALRALADDLDGLDPHSARRRAVDGFVDLVLDFRHELSAYPAAIQRIVVLPELADLEFERNGRRLLTALAGGSDDPVEVVAAHVVCIGVLTTTVTLMDAAAAERTGPDDPLRVDLDPTSLREALIAVADRTLTAHRR